MIRWFGPVQPKEVWYEENGLRFKHGTRVEIVGVSDSMSRHANRVGEIVGLTKATRGVYIDGNYHLLQGVFLID